MKKIHPYLHRPLDGLHRDGPQAQKLTDGRRSGREIAAADSLRSVALRQAALIDSLQSIVLVADRTAGETEAPGTRTGHRPGAGRSGFGGGAAPAPPSHENRVHLRHQRPDRARHPGHGKRRRAGDTVQQQQLEIHPQPRGGQRQHDFREILGHDDALSLQRGRHVGNAQIGGDRPRRLADQLPLPLSGFGTPARQIRPAAPAPAPGRGPAAEDGRSGIRHLLRPRAHLAVQQGRLRQSGDHPPRQRAGDLLRPPVGTSGGTRPVGRGGGRSSVWAVRRAVRRVPISISKPVTTGSRSTPNA